MENKLIGMRMGKLVLKFIIKMEKSMALL